MLITLENSIILILLTLIITQITILLVCIKTQDEDEQRLSKAKDELLNNDGKKYLRLVSLSPNWRIIMIASMALTFLILGFIGIIFYIFNINIKLEGKRLLIVLFFSYLIILFMSIISMTSLLNYYNYHVLHIREKL